MTHQSDEQNGHNRPLGRYRRAQRGKDVPVDVLRAFARRLLQWYSVRGLSKMLKVVKPTTVQNFVDGRTKPEHKTKKAFSRLYHIFHPVSYLEKRRVPYREVVPQLKTVLPEGEEAALRFVDALIEGGEDAVNESPEAFREWVRSVVKAEYATMRRFAKYERKRRPKGSGSSPNRSKKKAAPPDTIEK